MARVSTDYGKAVIQPPEDYFDASTTFEQSDAPQSGEIFGILKQMKEPFETSGTDCFDNY